MEHGRSVDSTGDHYGGSGSKVPPGFRFHPTDEELVNCYLRRKVMASESGNLQQFDLDHVIRDLDLNKLEPWDLGEKCKIDASRQTEWYFFCHKDKKYPTGTRTNRATKAGFWKATGRDKVVLGNSSFSTSSCQVHSPIDKKHNIVANNASSNGGHRIGMRKTLVFYKGRAPHGLKTDWIMHEYRLYNPSPTSQNVQPQTPNSCHHQRQLQRSSSSYLATSNNNSQEGGWVVCRVFKKRNYEDIMSSCGPFYGHGVHESLQLVSSSPTSDAEQAMDSLVIKKEINEPKGVIRKRSRKEEGGGRSIITVHEGANPTENPSRATICKQEMVEEAKMVPDSQATTYLQLPQLESPKTMFNPANCGHTHKSTDTDKLGMRSSDLHHHHHHHHHHRMMKGHGNPMEVHQESSCGNNTNTTSNNKPLIPMTEADFTDNSYSNIGPIGEPYSWNVYEAIARYNGSDGSPSFTNDQSLLNYNMHHLINGRMQHPNLDTYPSNSCEIELWNFPG